jgi:hypothetical protein
MTAREACALLVNTVRELSMARAERDLWRGMALAWMHQAADLRRELEMVDARCYVHRTRTQDDRDMFRDQIDLRRDAA